MLEGVGQSNEPSQLRQINFDLGKKAYTPALKHDVDI